MVQGGWEARLVTRRLQEGSIPSSVLVVVSVGKTLYYFYYKYFYIFQSNLKLTNTMSFKYIQRVLYDFRINMLVGSSTLLLYSKYLIQINVKFTCFKIHNRLLVVKYYFMLFKVFFLMLNVITFVWY